MIDGNNPTCMKLCEFYLCLTGIYFFAGEDLLAIAADQPFRFPATFTFVVRAFSGLNEHVVLKCFTRK